VHVWKPQRMAHLSRRRNSSNVEAIRLYTTRWCVDCWRAKQFLDERGVLYEEVDVDEDTQAEELIVRVNEGRRKIPTIEVQGRYFACSPFDPEQLAGELKIPLNP
jgi:mycoredoxin